MAALRRLWLLPLCLLLMGQDYNAPFRPRAAGGGDPNSSPGSQAADLSGIADRGLADTGAAFGTGWFGCMYWKWPPTPSGTPQRIAFRLLDGTTVEQETLATNGSNPTWPTFKGEVWNGGGASQECGATYTANTTNTWVACLLALDGVSDDGGARLWILEETSADTWTERCDIANSQATIAQTDAAFEIGSDAGGTDGLQAIVKYFWVRDDDFNTNRTDAASETEMLTYLGCSVDPADAQMEHVWPFTNTSTSSEPDAVSGGTAMALTGATRSTGAAVWSGFGSGTNAECDE